MVSSSIIQKSQLEGGLRLDAEFYHPEKLEAMEKLSKFGVSTITENFRNVKETFNPLRHQLATTPARVFDLSDVSSFLLEEGKEIMEADEVGSTKKIFRQNDVLISRLRPYLKEVSFVGFNDVQKLASTEFIVLRKKKDSKFPPQALFAFLITDEVQKILFWSQGGTEHPRFSENLLMDLKLPKISEKIAENITGDVNSAYKNYLISRNLYSQAEGLLLEELGLKNFEVEEDLFYIVNLSEIKSSHRVDAEYFQPKYENLIMQIKKKVEMKQLKAIATTKRGSLIDPRFYSETEGTPYIRGKDFSSGRLEKSGLVYISIDFRPKNETRVNAGDLVFALIGSVGTSALVNEEFHNSFISNNTGKISIKNKKEVLPEYLAAVLNSIVGKLQFEKEASQTAQPKISDSQVRNFYIPILPQFTQQKIADLVQKSHEARSKAKQLLEEAKNKVANLIEVKS